MTPIEFDAYSVRYILTIVAVALVAALSAALVVPVFVDWSSHRAEIEARLSAMTGARVSIAGPIEIRLLPTPYVTLESATVAGVGDGAPSLAVGRARLELMLVKLMGGQILFSQAEFDEPVLTLSRTVNGALRLPLALPEGRAETIALERVSIRGGRVRLVAPDGAAQEIAGLDLDASAASLIGPFRGSGAFAAGERGVVKFQISSGPIAAGGASVKAVVGGGAGQPELTLDGALEAAADAASPGAARLSYSGGATLTGSTDSADDRPALPWRLTGKLVADIAGARLEAASLSLGPEERALQASGAISLAFGAPARLEAALKAKPLNLDALFRRKGEDKVAPARALRLLGAALAPLAGDSGWPVASAIGLEAPSGVLGGEALSDISLDASLAPGALLHTRFSLALPGRSRLAGEGDWEGGAAPTFRGAIDAEAGDYERLRDWASAGASEAAARLAALSEALPYRSAALAGKVVLSPVSFSGRDLALTLDRTRLAGAIDFTRPVGEERGRLFVDLAADSLDVDALPNLSAGAGLVGDIDFAVALRARALHVARVGEAEVNGGSLEIKASKAGAQISLDRLAVAGLGGADFEASGAIGPSGRRLSGRLAADKLKDLAFLASRIAPADWTRLILERAEALSPAKLTFEARGGADGADLAGLDVVTASGALGATEASVALKRDGAGRTLTLTLDAPDAGAFLRQLGLKGAGRSTGKAHVAVSARGDWAAGLDGQAAVSLAGADLSFRGRVMPEAKLPDEAMLFGAATLKGADLSPLLQTLGQAPSGGLPLGPLEASADVTLRGDRWTISRLAGAAVGAKFTGNLVYRPGQERAVALADADVALAQALAGETPSAEGRPAGAAPPVALEGELSFDRLPLGGLLALELGSPRPAKPPARWSDAKFAPAPLEPPASDIALKVGALDLGDLAQAQSFRARLRLGRARLDLDDMAMNVAGGTAAGRVTLRRDGRLAALDGALLVDGIALSRAGFAGRVGATLDFASTGQSAAGLAEGVAGQGELRIAAATLAKSDLGALERVIARSQANDALIDETNVAHALEVELDKRAANLPDGATPVAASGGLARIGPMAIARANGEASLRATFDLRTLALETRLALSDREPLKFWTAPTPSATATVKNALDAPARQVDVSALSAGLSAQTIARESERIAELEADMRERAYFNRRLKAERFLRRREAELAAWAEEQARLKALAERRHAEAEAQRVADEKAAAEKAAAEQAAAEKAAAEKAAAEKAAAEKAAAEKAAAEKAAAAKAAADKAAAEKAAAEKAAAEKAAAEKAAAAKAAADKAAADKAAADKAAADKAAADKAAAEKAAAEKAAADKAAADKAAAEAALRAATPLPDEAPAPAVNGGPAPPAAPTIAPPPSGIVVEPLPAAGPPNPTAPPAVAPPLPPAKPKPEKPRDPS